MGEGASEELEQATENLRQLELSYKRAAAGMPVFNYDLENKEIAEAKKAEADALAAMQAALSELTGRDVSLATYEEDMRAAEAQLNAALGAQEDVKAVVANEQKDTWLWVQVLEEREVTLQAQTAAETPATPTPADATTPSPFTMPRITRNDIPTRRS